MIEMADNAALIRGPLMIVQGTADKRDKEQRDERE